MSVRLHGNHQTVDRYLKRAFNKRPVLPKNVLCRKRPKNK